MKAYVCDRCDDFFVKSVDFKKYGVVPRVVPSKILDLCPTCQAELDKWVDELKEETKCTQ